MKKILIVQQYFYPDISAVSQLLGDLLFNLSKDPEYQITVLTGTVVKSEKNIDIKIAKEEIYKNVLIKRIRTTTLNGKVFSHRFFEYISFVFRTFSFILKKKRNYDLVVVFTTPPLIGYFVSLAIGNSKIPFIYYIEDLYPELLFDMGYIKKDWIIRKLRFFNNRILQKAEKIITIGSYMSRKLFTNYKKDNDITIINNWTQDTEYIKPKVDDKFNITYSGNLGLAHDFSNIVTLLDELEKRNLNISFSFIGGGKQYEAVKNMFNNIKIENNFSGYKKRDEHLQVLNDANMFIISQKPETVGDIVPSKFYSYISSGRPLLFLGTEKSEIGQFIVDKEAGCVLEVEDDKITVANYIEKMIENKKEYLLTCKKISDFYNSEFGFTKSFNLFEKIIDECTR